MNKKIKSDLFRYTGQDYNFKIYLKYLFKSPAFLYTVFFRKVNTEQKSFICLFIYNYLVVYFIIRFLKKQLLEKDYI